MMEKFSEIVVDDGIRLRTINIKECASKRLHFIHGRFNSEGRMKASEGNVQSAVLLMDQKRVAAGWFCHHGMCGKAIGCFGKRVIS